MDETPKPEKVSLVDPHSALIAACDRFIERYEYMPWDCTLVKDAYNLVKEVRSTLVDSSQALRPPNEATTD